MTKLRILHRDQIASPERLYRIAQSVGATVDPPDEHSIQLHNTLIVKEGHCHLCDRGSKPVPFVLVNEIGANQ
ncbi:hypothetical protein KA005_36385 [bacterium]|nr:hypothetical protein [bacterium]